MSKLDPDGKMEFNVLQQNKFMYRGCVGERTTKQVRHKTKGTEQCVDITNGLITPWIV